jgi:hypothetical protein
MDSAIRPSVSQYDQQQFMKHSNDTLVFRWIENRRRHGSSEDF